MFDLMFAEVSSSSPRCTWNRELMLHAGAEEQSEDVLQSEQSQDVLQPEDVSTDKADESCEPELTCAVETTDADDDNDEFVEWNEGDGSVNHSYCTDYNIR